jgi:histidinol phosphatase-like enzyme
MTRKRNIIIMEATGKRNSTRYSIIIIIGKHREDAQLDHRFNTNNKKYRSNKNRRQQENQEDSQQ